MHSPCWARGLQENTFTTLRRRRQRNLWPLPHLPPHQLLWQGKSPLPHQNLQLYLQFIYLRTAHLHREYKRSPYRGRVVPFQGQSTRLPTICSPSSDSLTYPHYPCCSLCRNRDPTPILYPGYMDSDGGRSSHFPFQGQM